MAKEKIVIPMSPIPVPIKVKKLSQTATLPTRTRATDAGWDIYTDQKITIPANTVKAVSTNVACEIPEGYYLKIEERSGFSLENTLKLKAGVVDSEYRGEIRIVFQNAGDYPIAIEKGAKIAQMILHTLTPTELIEVSELSASDRGDKGFGSSDKNK